MTSVALVDSALQALAGIRQHRVDAVALVTRTPGLYAFYGDAQAWSDLGLSPAFADQPLYVGKAERSLHGRDVGTHFTTGRTGSSTLRRSLAALLANDLHLIAVPRNPARPDGSAHFGLDAVSDAHLSDWMEEHLRLATWVGPADLALTDVETAVLRHLRPPLNLTGVGESRKRLRAARRRLADLARARSPVPLPGSSE